MEASYIVGPGMPKPSSLDRMVSSRLTNAMRWLAGIPSKQQSISSTTDYFSDHAVDTDHTTDHSDSDTVEALPVAGWGPAAFMHRDGLEEILADPAVREVEPGYDLQELVRELAAGSRDANPFYVVNLSTIMEKVYAWERELPRIRPFYAVKCNGDEKLCRMLAMAGCGFDCASKAEIEQMLALGARPADLIYANPCKQTSMLHFAKQAGVRKMTADNVEELHKIQQVFPAARVLIRIAVDDSQSVCRFNSKFGSPKQEWDLLMRTAKKLELDIAGISFHVGSGCGDLKPFADAVSTARDAFDLAESYGFKPTILDVGGGWPGSDDGNFSFSAFAAVVRDAIDHYFPAESGVEVIAEPGRYFAHASHTYAVSVIAKRQLSNAQLANTAEIESFGAQPSKDSAHNSIIDDGFKKVEVSENTPEVALFINDGVYGSFNCVVFDHALLKPKPLTPRDDARIVATKLFGPTCDSIDVVIPCTRLPEMHVGDWLWFAGMGAYTRCAASRFNGQGHHDIHYIWSGMPRAS